MSQISAAAVRALRDRTDMPMMDCKTALTEANGDMDKAVQLLREKGKNFIIKKGDREAAEGRIGTFVDNAAKLAGIVELRCETPSVVKNDLFVKLANEIAKQLAHHGATDVASLVAQPSVEDAKLTVQDRINEVVGLIRENMKPARFAQAKNLAGDYVHHDGTIGVLIEVTGERADPTLLRDIAAHVAAMNPQYAKPDEVPADIVAREREFAKQQAEQQAAGKPANIIEKIAEGKLKTWFAENTLIEQPMANAIKYDKKTVGQLLKSAGLELVKFTRFKVGELSK
jgi:elongation factor Ts